MKALDKVLHKLAKNQSTKNIDSANYHKIRNSGYSAGGANLEKNALSKFDGESVSPVEDIDKNLHILRQRCRLLYMQAPIASAAINTNRTNIIGSGLQLKSRIDFRYLGLSQQQADEWERSTEREFSLWADSTCCDIKGIDNFYALQNIALTGWLLNGDSFALIKYAADIKQTPYSLKIQLIEADRISTPDSYKNRGIIKQLDAGNKIYNGVEIDKEGMVRAYHICSHYHGGSSIEQKKWTRVQRVGEKTQLPNIIHVMDAERAEQYRGVPYLAKVIESMKQVNRYTEAELMAAVINSYFTLFIQTENGTEKVGFAGAAGMEEENEDRGLKLGPGIINILKKGETVAPVDPKRPNVNFDMFMTSMCKHIGACLELPYEVLLKSFNASYSASRASMLEAGKAYKMRRAWFAQRFCQPIYEIFLAEAVALGRIKAPAFFDDPAVRKAWCSSEWNGPAQGQIDPIKEVKAAELRIAAGLSTREKETMELTGGNFDRNVEQLIMENEKLSEIIANLEKI